MLFKLIKKIKKINLFIKHNKRIFENSKNTKKFKILVDQFNYYPSLIPISHFIERLKKSIMQMYIYETFINKSLFSYFKSLLNDFLPFGFLIFIHHSDIIKFYVSLMIKLLNHRNKIRRSFIKLKTKNDVLDIYVDNIYIGDLLYDSFLMAKNKPTLNINSKI